MLVKIHTSLAAVCVKQKLEHPYFVWLIAKTLSKGSGKCKISFLKKVYIDLFGVSSKTFYNHLEKGTDIFYKIDKPNLYIKSLEKIMAQFDPVMAFSTCVEIDISDTGLKAKEILVSLVSSADKFKKPVGINFLAGMMGQSRSTIKRNINEALVKKRRNIINHMYSWNSYDLVSGKILPSDTEKKFAQNFKKPKNNRMKLKKHTENQKWSVKFKD